MPGDVRMLSSWSPQRWSRGTFQSSYRERSWTKCQFYQRQKIRSFMFMDISGGSSCRWPSLASILLCLLQLKAFASIRTVQVLLHEFSSSSLDNCERFMSEHLSVSSRSTRRRRFVRAAPNWHVNLECTIYLCVSSASMERPWSSCTRILTFAKG